MRMCRKITTIALKLISGFLGLFLANCGPVAVEYGCPNADYIVKGTIRDKVSGQPVPNANAYLMGRDSSYLGTLDSTISDNSGYYGLATNVCGYEPDTLFLKFSTSHSQKDTFAIFKDAQFSGNDGKWYRGKAEREIDVEL